jgi:hypothetical protein
MGLDRERIARWFRDARYWIGDLRQADAARKRKILIIGGGGLVLLVLVIVRLVTLLPSGPDAAEEGGSLQAVAPEVAEAQKAAALVLESDARFASVRVVTIPQMEGQGKGQLMFMGHVTSESQLKQLQQQIGRDYPGVPVSWQVGVAGK